MNLQREFSRLYYLHSGETLQFFTACRHNCEDTVNVFVVDHSQYPSASEYLKSLRMAGIDHPLFDKQYDYLRTSYQDEVETILAQAGYKQLETERELDE
jgi:hypothetical protein